MDEFGVIAKKLFKRYMYQDSCKVSSNGPTCTCKSYISLCARLVQETDLIYFSDSHEVVDEFGVIAMKLFSKYVAG